MWQIYLIYANRGAPLTPAIPSFHYNRSLGYPLLHNELYARSRSLQVAMFTGMVLLTTYARSRGLWVPRRFIHQPRDTTLCVRRHFQAFRVIYSYSLMFLSPRAVNFA